MRTKASIRTMLQRRGSKFLQSCNDHALICIHMHMHLLDTAGRAIATSAGGPKNGGTGLSRAEACCCCSRVDNECLYVSLRGHA